MSLLCSLLLNDLSVLYLSEQTAAVESEILFIILSDGLI